MLLCRGPPAVLLLYMHRHPWLRWLVLVGVVDFPMDLVGQLMVAAINVDGTSSVSFLEWACLFISDASVSIVDTALACNW